MKLCSRRVEGSEEVRVSPHKGQEFVDIVESELNMFILPLVQMPASNAWVDRSRSAQTPSYVVYG